MKMANSILSSHQILILHHFSRNPSPTSADMLAALLILLAVLLLFRN